jgi:hypothetical protein
MTLKYPRRRTPTWRERLFAGGLTVVTAGIGLLDWAALTSFVVHPLIYAYATPMSIRLWDSLSVVVLILSWLVLVYLSAYSYQKAVMRHAPWRLFMTMTLVQIALPALGVAIVRLVLT